MHKKKEFAGVILRDFIGAQGVKSFTLIELLVSMVIVTLMVVGFYSFEIYSNTQVLDTNRRVKVQSDLVYIVEHMSRYIQQANGDENNPPIILYPTVGVKRGFQVRYDCNVVQTPSDLTDDVWVYYALVGNNLSVGCSGICSSVPAEVLSSKIVMGFNNSIMPVNPTDGFYVSVDALGNLVNIGLVGRYDPSRPVSGRYVNPQVTIKTKVICNSASSV